MSEDELNGSAKIILMRLTSVEQDLKEMKTTLTALRDYQLSHTLCTKPGMCIELKECINRLDENQQRAWDVIYNTRRLVLIGLGIVATLGVFGPALFSLLIKGHI